MAKFEIVEGAQGQGKSLYTARQAIRLLKRNKAWYAKQLVEWKHSLELREKTLSKLLAVGYFRGSRTREEWEQNHPIPDEPKPRRIAPDMKFSDAFEKEHEGWIVYWSGMHQLTQLRDVDVLWDEIAKDLDSRNWALLTAEELAFLSQIRKRGIDIYANTQDFSMVDARARIMITGVYTLYKIIGSPDLSATKPAPKKVWGLVWIKRVDNFKETVMTKKKYSLLDLFNFMIIEKELTDVYDTRQIMARGTLPPLRHSVRKCELHGEACTFVKVSHT